MLNILAKLYHIQHTATNGTRKQEMSKRQLIKYYSLRLAEGVQEVLCRNKFPIVLGGDCSIPIGNVLALKCLGRNGLFFIDGHTDFYKPEEST